MTAGLGQNHVIKSGGRSVRGLKPMVTARLWGGGGELWGARLVDEVSMVCEPKGVKA
jgi:hypothetical protein